MVIERLLLSLDEIKEIIFCTPGFFTCRSGECKQSIASPEELKSFVWGKLEDNSFVNINGTNFAYTIKGEGECIFLLHGMRDCKEIMKPLAEKLSKTYCVVSIDFRGHGYSDKVVEDYSTSQFADDVIAIAEKIGVKKFNLMGHSLGASISLELALKRPDMVNKIILAGTSVNEKHGIYKPINPEGLLKDPEKLNNCINMLNAVFFMHYQSDEQKETLFYIREKAILSWTMRDTEISKKLYTIHRTALADQISKIKSPVMIMVGEKDIVGTLEQAKFIKNLIPESYICTIRNAGHYMFLEYPDVAAVDILDFLKHNDSLL